MLISEIIRKKRDAKALEPAEIGEFVAAITDGRARDAQIAAMAMAVYFNGLDDAETVALTLAMRDSGDVLDWSDLGRPVADKHSTGGVGDNVSLMLAPMAAACGLAVPMISGRGLGHTGGTLDKMDSIPGYNTQPDNALFRRVTREAGCAIIGQTANLAPADKRFYAVRDVTATVEQRSLITASILSKKLAAGLGSLVLDVKFGSGAFMDSAQKARTLAEALVTVANGAGTTTTALMTDMNEPLASAAGNAVEVINAIEFLTGAHRDARLETVTVSLVAEMLVSAGLYASAEDARKAAMDALESGRAAEIFGRMVAALGGPPDIVENYRDHLPRTAMTLAIEPAERGFVASIDTRAIGLAVVEMGGGRRRREDSVDPGVGLTGLKGIGEEAGPGQALAIAHVHDEAMAAQVSARVLAACTLAGEKPEAGPVVLTRIGPRAAGNA